MHAVEIPDWYPLRTIWEEHLQEVCSEKQLKEWANRIDHFPEPKRKMGVYNLYDIDEVIQWVYLWKRVTAGLGNPTLNKQKGTGDAQRTGS